MNLYTAIDPFLLDRGLIAGMVSISLNPSAFHSISALINGMIAGVIYISSLKMF